MTSKWISTLDRLPRHGMDVLVTDGGRIEVRNLVSIEHYCNGKYGRSDYWYPGGSGVYGMTHWMPLPDMPEKKQ